MDPLLALAAPAVVFFVGSFVACQFPLHARMIECKRTELFKLDRLVNELTPQDPADMTEERQKQVDHYNAELRRVSNWPEWPFSLGNLSGVVGTSVGAVAPQLIPLLFSAFKHSGRVSP